MFTWTITDSNSFSVVAEILSSWKINLHAKNMLKLLKCLSQLLLMPKSLPGSKLIWDRSIKSCSTWWRKDDRVSYTRHYSITSKNWPTKIFIIPRCSLSSYFRKMQISRKLIWKSESKKRKRFRKNNSKFWGIFAFFKSSKDQFYQKFCTRLIRIKGQVECVPSFSILLEN